MGSTGEIDHSVESTRQVVELADGDVYEGRWVDGKSDGEGMYRWEDGSEYEGEWREGMKHGYGVYRWKSGSTYKGQWFEGRMQGYGTYDCHDGTRYMGSWQNDRMHGLGKKEFANGDVYDGLWKNGQVSGMGRYIWKDGNEYNGEWLDGQMNNRGTFVFSNGNRYDGEWSRGKEHGRGLFTWTDGGFYQGRWEFGKKHGQGVYYPAHVVKKRWRASSKLGPTMSNVENGIQRKINENDRNMSEIERKGGSIERQGSSIERNASDVDQPVNDVELTTSDVEQKMNEANQEISDIGQPVSASGKESTEDEVMYSARPDFDEEDSGSKHMNGGVEIEHHLDDDAERENKTGESEGEGSKRSYVVYREYNMGELVSEETEELNGEKIKILGRQWGSYREAYQAHQHRRKSSTILKKKVRKAAKKAGETIYRGHRSYDLMTSLQLGIRWAVGKNSMPKTEIQDSDFTEKEAVSFPRAGSSLTPPHEAFDFKWKGYAPNVFKALRSIFKLDPADYMLSICGEKALRELPSPGKSGSVFFLSHDDKYLIKTMKKSEVKKLREILPAYYEHVKSYPETLLVKFFGLHRIKLHKGNKVSFVVMSNVVNTDLHLSERYDLKGSIYGRTARDKDGKVKDPDTVTYKDLDLQAAFKMNPISRQRTIRQIERDCKFLEQQDIMDYSLMLGVHIVDADVDLDESETVFNSEGIEEGATGEDNSIADLHKSMLREMGVNGDLVPALGENSGENEIRGGVDHVGYSTPNRKDNSSFNTQLPSSPPSIDSAYWQKPETIGINMTSVVVPAPDNAVQKGKGTGSSDLFDLMKEGARREVRMFFGIIDILQEYSISKRVEANYYKFVRGNGVVSAVDPQFYAKRFRDFMATIFVAE